MSELNATGACLLGFLHEGPKTGWDLVTEIQHGFTHFWNVTPSHVYRELKTLQARGHIEAAAAGARDRQPYTITAQGRHVFAEWIRQPPGTETMRIPLLVTLWFGAHLEPQLLREFLTRHREINQSRLDYYRRVPAELRDTNPYLAAVVDFGVAYERAVLDWIDHLEALPDIPSTTPNQP